MTEREYSDQGEHLGIGFDSLQEEFRSTAIDLKEVNENELRKTAETSSSRENYSFDYIQNKKELSKSFNVSVTVSGVGLLGATPFLLTGNAKGAYFSNKDIKTDNLYILLNYQLVNSGYRIKNPQLSDEAKNLIAESSSPAEFRKKYGDEFIKYLGGIDYL